MWSLAIGVYVFDFDDILVPFSYDMYNEIRKLWRKYNHYFVDLGLLKEADVYKRPVYNMNEWLIHPKYIKMNSEEYAATQAIIIKNFYDDYFNRADLYDYSVPTEFAKRTLMNPLFINDSQVKKVYILSRSMSKAAAESKRKFIEKYFNNPKIETIIVLGSERKSDAIIKHGIQWNVFIDDELPNIRDFAERFNSLEKKEFLIPKYGYNKMPEELRNLIEGKGGIITYYDPKLK